MEDLLKPDYGVLALTVCNFLLLVYLLKKFAWNRIIGALESREQQIAQDKLQAQQAREAAEKIKSELDEKLAQIADEAAKKMAEAVKMGETQKEQLLAAAKEQSERLAEQAKAQIEAEKNKALSDVRGEIARVSVLAASKVIEQQLNEDAAKAVVDRVLAEVKAK
ncbi:F0F1 ATP synthase subunit B [Candidatus Avelusimicrobium fimicolum]|jgi:F-type H+-transporting ATPase subunit b|uniref:F0F1 ATP synthase subunit B n=1 Tax=Candidatus Avelusimicrobium TaxID=2840538 RepID=UPI0015AB0AD2|nr:F0F1 ATP synthase subunit B [Elusimicrobiaceae bacterium]